MFAVVRRDEAGCCFSPRGASKRNNQDYAWNRGVDELSDRGSVGLGEESELSSQLYSLSTHE